MAFVFCSQRDIDKLPSKQGPSPADYQVQAQRPKATSCAPFASSSRRKTKNDSKSGLQPGPGEYDVGGTMAQSVISSYFCKNNVIVKINSMGTSSFQSLERRFQPARQAIPQSQSKKSPPKQKVLVPLAKNQKRKRPKQPAGVRIASIPHSSRDLLNANQTLPTPQDDIMKAPGPGSYEPTSPKYSNNKGAIWASDSIERFPPQVSDQAGPGSYNLSPRMTRPVQNANFKSGTVRNYLDTVVYETTVEQIASRRKNQNFKSPNPAPGQYHQENEQEDKRPQFFQFFGSNAQRFPKIKTETKPFYCSPSLPQRSFNQGKQPFGVSASREASFLGKSDQMPGPGEYQYFQNKDGHRKGKVIQCFGSTIDRLSIKNSEENGGVGPGQYNPQTVKVSINKEDELQSSVFRSKSNRQPVPVTNLQSPGHEYDVTNNDLGARVNRQKMMIQNLRKIDVERPPFQSSHPRFAHYQQKLSSSPTHKQQSSVSKKPKRQAVRELPGTKGWGFGKVRRFVSERKGGGNPGVGNYTYLDEFSKPSFNARFMEPLTDL